MPGGHSQATRGGSVPSRSPEPRGMGSSEPNLATFLHCTLSALSYLLSPGLQLSTVDSMNLAICCAPGGSHTRRDTSTRRAAKSILREYDSYWIAVCAKVPTYIAPRAVTLYYVL